MLEPIQTPDEGTETTEPVTQPTNTEEPVTPETQPNETETPSTEGVAEPVSESQPEVVPKEKFVASQRESILNHERVKVANSRIEQLTKQDTPTDEAMRQLYPEWDQLDDYNKRVLVRQETIAMQQARTLAKQQEIEERQRLDEQLEDVIENSQYAPKLKGKEAEFKRFAKRKENLGINAEVLAKAFLYDGSDVDPITPTQPAPKPEGLPAGNGGPREPLKPKKISLEEAANIRKTDFTSDTKSLYCRALSKTTSRKYLVLGNLTHALSTRH